MAQVSAQKAAALQVGYSREYLVKLVGAEQKRRDDEEGIQYEYNTEVCSHPVLASNKLARQRSNDLSCLQSLSICRVAVYKCISAETISGLQRL